MGGRRDDRDPEQAPRPPARARSAADRPSPGPRAAQRPAPRAAEAPASRAAEAPAPRERDRPAVDTGTPSRRWVPGQGVVLRAGLGLGLVLAVGGTVVVLLTDDARYLRLATLAVCWAFVVAALLAGARRADQVAAAGREAELRHGYDLELEREVAARYQYELELESRLRREAEDAMRTELTALRGQLTALSRLQDDLAEVGRLRTRLAVLDELRAELAGLGELRADLGRMRAELAEQLSGELLIERMVMRAQSVRGPALTGQAEDRAVDGTPDWASATDRWGGAPADPAPRPVAAQPPVPPPPPRERPPATDDLPVTGGYDGARYDDLLFGAAPAEDAGWTSGRTPSWSVGEDRSADSWTSSSAVSVPAEVAPAGQPDRPPAGPARLEQILAESGVPAPSGGRSRRRRYRDEDDAVGDDVLARVLGRG